MIGTTLAHYKITAKLGVGGMGEVYRATDTKLDREVAIKVLPEEFARNPERLARFEREAKALARLSHPNIGAIYGFDQHEDQWFIVLELIEGQTLADQLRPGPMPVEKTLKIFKQIAEALEAAHEKEIVHRDLKPANIKIDPQGRVKVLDFGLAKARFTQDSSADSQASTADSMAPTITSQFTHPGKVMGTAAYMSPEQSRGQEVDRRTDVWAFGCCLYEALTGRKPFKGQTVSDLLAEILKSDPDFTVIPPETPGEVLTLLRRCLEKDPQRRLRYLGDIALTLEDVTETSRLNTVVRAKPQSRELADTRSGSKAGGWKTVAIMAMATAGIVTTVLLRQDTPSSQIRSLAVVPFENLKPDDKEPDYLRETLPFELRKQLEKLEAFTVTPAKTERTDATIKGQFVKNADQIQVQVSMEHRNGSSKTLFDIIKPESNIFDLQAEIALKVAEKIRGGLTDQELSQITAPAGVNSQAYIAFRKGLEFLDREESERAAAFFNKALELDPGMNAARSQLVMVRLSQSSRGGYKEDEGEVFKNYKEYVTSLPIHVQNNLDFAEARLWTSFVYDRDWKAFRKLHESFVEQIEGSSESDIAASALFPIAWYYTLFEGRLGEALRIIAAGSTRAPNRSWGMDHADTLFLFGYKEEARRVLRNELKDQEFGQRDCSSILRVNGDLIGAKAMVTKILKSSPNATTLCSKAAIDLAEGNHSAARAVLMTFEQQKQNGLHLPYGQIAFVYGQLGEFENAFRWLQYGVDHGRGDFSIMMIRTVPHLEVFAEQPSYWKIIEQMDFPPLPPEHKFYETEQRMRYGKGDVAVSIATNIPPKILAVLPFETGGTIPGGEDLAKGLDWDLIDALNGIKGDELIIKGPGEVQRLKSAGKSAGEIGTELSASHVLAGRITGVADRLRFNVILTSVADGNVLWATNDISASSSVASHVASALRIVLVGEQAQKLIARPTEKDEAFQLYLKGRGAWNKRTIPDFERAIGFYEQALAKDTNFALAYSGLAAVHAVWNGYDSKRSEVHRSKAMELARRAQELDARLAEPHAIIGFVKGFYDFDWTGAEREFQAAIQLNPDSPDAYQWYAETLISLGKERWGEALQLAEKSVQLDPTIVRRTVYYILLFRKGHRSQEIADALDWVEREPHWLGFQMMHHAFVFTEDLERAHDVLKRVEESSLDHAAYEDRVALLRAWTFALQGNATEARELLDRTPGSVETRVYRALTHLALKDKDVALRLFDQDIEEWQGDSKILMYLPECRSLYGDPRFRAILRKLNLESYYPDPTASKNP